MSNETYQSARSRLEEILDEVNRDDVSLDDALALYEEAVKLSLAACDLSESDLSGMSEAADDSLWPAEMQASEDAASAASDVEDEGSMRDGDSEHAVSGQVDSTEPSSF